MNTRNNLFDYLTAQAAALAEEHPLHGLQICFDPAVRVASPYWLTLHKAQFSLGQDAAGNWRERAGKLGLVFQAAVTEADKRDRQSAYTKALAVAEWFAALLDADTSLGGTFCDATLSPLIVDDDALDAHPLALVKAILNYEE
jgi:hypothetical protein